MLIIVKARQLWEEVEEEDEEEEEEEGRGGWRKEESNEVSVMRGKEHFLSDLGVWTVAERVSLRPSSDLPTVDVRVEMKGDLKRRGPLSFSSPKEVVDLSVAAHRPPDRDTRALPIMGSEGTSTVDHACSWCDGFRCRCV
jgi:hypothetical protein